MRFSAAVSLCVRHSQKLNQSLTIAVTSQKLIHRCLSLVLRSFSYTLRSFNYTKESSRPTPQCWQQQQQDPRRGYQAWHSRKTYECESIKSENSEYPGRRAAPGYTWPGGGLPWLLEKFRNFPLIIFGLLFHGCPVRPHFGGSQQLKRSYVVLRLRGGGISTWKKRVGEFASWGVGGNKNLDFMEDVGEGKKNGMDLEMEKWTRIISQPTMSLNETYLRP